MGSLPPSDRPHPDSGPATSCDIAHAPALARRLAGRSAGLARDATYTVVGLGLLTFQRAQVWRREFERAQRG